MGNIGQDCPHSLVGDLTVKMQRKVSVVLSVGPKGTLKESTFYIDSLNSTTTEQLGKHDDRGEVIESVVVDSLMASSHGSGSVVVSTKRQAPSSNKGILNHDHCSNPTLPNYARYSLHPVVYEYYSRIRSVKKNVKNYSRQNVAGLGFDRTRPM
jgi:hypothetical protein